MEFKRQQHCHGGRRSRHREIYWHRHRHRDFKIESFQICRLRRDGRRGGGGGGRGGGKSAPRGRGRGGAAGGGEGGGWGGGARRGEHNAPRRGLGDGERDRNADARHYSC